MYDGDYYASVDINNALRHGTRRLAASGRRWPFSIYDSDEVTILLSLQ